MHAKIILSCITKMNILRLAKIVASKDENCFCVRVKVYLVRHDLLYVLSKQRKTVPLLT